MRFLRGSDWAFVSVFSISDVLDGQSQAPKEVKDLYKISEARCYRDPTDRDPDTSGLLLADGYYYKGDVCEELQ